MYCANILHRDFYYLGGAERVALAFIKYFQVFTKNGIKIHLFTKKISPDLFSLMRVYGISPIGLNIVNLGGIPLLDKTIYSSLGDILLFKHAKRFFTTREREPIILVNTKFNEVPIAADLCFIHYPTYIVLKKNPYDPSLLGPVLSKDYMSSKLLYMYIKPLIEVCYDLMVKEVLKCKAILFNSNFTMHVFKKYINSTVLNEIKEIMYVVHPPFINEVRIAYNESNLDRRYFVIRFKPLTSCPFKVWSNIVAEIAKNFKEVTIIVMGFAKSKLEISYIDYLHKLMRDLGLNNVKILVNVSEGIKNLILRKTKVYIHLIPYEHFGIMPLEALLHGANIVVHKMSGISMDINLQEPFVVRYAKYPFDVEELLDAISLSYNSENPPAELIQEVYWHYSFDEFKRVMDRIMEDIGYTS